MFIALAVISCCHANKALLNLIKIHARKIEADGFGKGYQYVCVCVCVWVCVHDGGQVFSDGRDKRWKLNNKSSPAVNDKRYQTVSHPGDYWECECVSVRKTDRHREREEREMKKPEEIIFQ